MNDQRIALTLESEQPTLERGTPTVLHAVLELSALGPAIDAPRPPLSVIFTLDVSGSMNGEPLQHVISSTERLLQLLRPIDRAGVVSFSTTAQVVTPLLPMAEANRTRAIHAVRRMVSQQSTGMEAGLLLARSLLPPRAAHERQVILLLSDGLPNVGERTPHGLGALARSMRPQVSVSSLGFGPSHDERVLASIAESGSGRYHYIPSPELCRGELGAALGAQGDVVAERIELSIRPRPGVEILAAIGSEARPLAGGGVAIDVPDMGTAARHLIALRLRVSAQHQLGQRSLVDAELRYFPAGGNMGLVISRTLEVVVAGAAAPMAIGPLHKILALRGAEEQRRARALADAGDFSAAARLLHEAVAMIRNAPGVREDDGSILAELCEQLIDDAALYTARPDETSYKAYVRGQRVAVGGNVGQGLAPEGALGRALALDAAGLVRPAILLNLNEGKSHALNRVRTLLGRSRCADLVVPSAQVSRQHAVIEAQDGAHWLRCMGSANGVFVNGSKVDSHRLRHGDRVSLGQYEFRYEELGER